MNDKMLFVDFDSSLERNRVVVPKATPAYVEMLAQQGYGFIKLFGLAPLGAKGFGRKPIADYFVSIDEDAALLLDYYLTLERVVANRETGRVCSYFGEGCFEFNAVLVDGAHVHLRVGVYDIGDEFEEPFRGSVVLDVQTYLRMWRSVAAGIVTAANGRTPPEFP